MITILLSAAFLCCSTCYRDTDVTTVPEVDLNRYMGRWYEISSYPQWFEKGMTDVSAYYTLREGYVEVVNSGNKDGERKEALGRAKVIPGYGNARLKVSFFRPFYGKYWIVDLAADYSWAVVSNPKRSALWVLSRTPAMDSTLYQLILNRLSDQGFDTSRLRLMQHQP